MDLDAARAAIESACEGLSNQDPVARKQAEQILLDFRASARPFATCRHILETSASEPAKFQAVLCFRDAAVREWSITPVEERQQMRYAPHALFLTNFSNFKFLNCMYMRMYKKTS